MRLLSGGVDLKIICIVLMMLMLSGCGAQPAWETVNDQLAEYEPACKKVSVELPEEAAAPVLSGAENGSLYLCDGYVLTTQILEGGDLDETMRRLTGFSLEQLTCVQTQYGAVKRYTCAWASVEDSGDQVGRAVVLDDGRYHYAVSVMADSALAAELSDSWRKILNSVTLTDTD